MEYNENREYEHLGSFTLSGTTMRVCDPMHRDNDPHALVEHCIPGKWNAWVVPTDDEGHASMLLAIAEGSGLPPETFNDIYTDDDCLYAENTCAIKLLETEVYTESAHCGIFDSDKYVRIENPWDFGSTTLPHGVFCHAYWGDGTYLIFVYKHPQKKEVAAIAVLFD